MQSDKYSNTRFSRPEPLARGSSFSRIKLSQHQIIFLGVGLLGFGMYLWQLTVPVFLQLYDSGVYSAAAIHFVSGELPYKDFVFVQPPGILLIMSPVALFSRVFGSHDGFIFARVVSAFVTALDASLLTWLVRHRGRLAMVLAGTGLALTPVAVFFSSGVRLEPYCICLVLLGSLRIFSSNGEDGELTTKSLAIGGLLFGLAALVEFWAFFPFIALMTYLVTRCHKRVLIFIGAAGGGFAAVALPFFLASPNNFVSEVFVEQLSRPGGSRSVLWRLIDMTGLSGTSIAPTAEEAVLAFAAFSIVIAFAYQQRLGHEGVDVFLLLAAPMTVIGLLAAPTAYTDYSYFAAPFLFGLLGISMARLEPAARRLANSVPISKTLRKFVAVLSALAGSLLIAALVLYVTSFYSIGERLYGTSAGSISQITSHIPAGSCVVYSEVGVGVLANRLQSSNPHCPSVVDPVGVSMAWGYELTSPAPGFISTWRAYFRAAQYVVVENPLIGSQFNAGSSSYRSLLPWNRSLTTWFSNHYHLVFGQFALYIYEKNSPA